MGGRHSPSRATPARGASPFFWRSLTNASRKTSPALYDDRTSGPLATYLKPIAIPSFRHASYSAGGTIRATGMWRLVGRRYCPNVKISTPAFSMSRIVCRTS